MLRLGSNSKLVSTLEELRRPHSARAISRDSRYMRFFAISARIRIWTRLILEVAQLEIPDLTGSTSVPAATAARGAITLHRRRNL